MYIKKNGFSQRKFTIKKFIFHLVIFNQYILSRNIKPLLYLLTNKDRMFKIF